jgi:GNAT superfamily N-acetyltransferase
MSENSSTKRHGDLAKYIAAGILAPALEIRKLSPDDANIITEFCRALDNTNDVKAREDADLIRYHSEENPDIYSAILIEECVVGLTRHTLKKEHTYIDSLIIHPEYRSLGLGAAVMNTIYHMNQCKPLKLEPIRKDNVMRFYYNLGGEFLEGEAMEDDRFIFNTAPQYTVNLDSQVAVQATNDILDTCVQGLQSAMQR